MKCDVVVMMGAPGSCRPQLRRLAQPGPATLSTFIVKDGKATKINRADEQWLVQACLHIHYMIMILPYCHSYTVLRYQ